METTAGTVNEITCSECGRSHQNQIDDYPLGSMVELQTGIISSDGGILPVGTKGYVIDHCDDGRAVARFEGDKTHTFHHPKGILKLSSELDAEADAAVKPFNLRARIHSLIANAWAAIAEDSPDYVRDVETRKISFYPARLRVLREQVNYLSEIQSELLKPYAEKINNIKFGIAEQTLNGKKVFSNEDSRRIELESRLANWPEYQNDLNEHAALTGAIKRLSLDLESTSDEFRAAKLIYERDTANILKQTGD